MSKKDEEDYHLRHQVVDSGMSAEDERIHEQGFATLQAAIDGGKPWRKAVAELKVADAQLKEIIIDDFLKVALATRHFQGSEPIKRIAAALGGVPMERLMEAKESMLKEVEEASVAAYHLSKELEKKAGHG